MSVSWEQIEPLLLTVEKPARYVGGEFNQIVKPASGAAGTPLITARACLAFPDLYEIGMSYHGFRLLYERINSNPNYAAERAFTPWPDMEAAMRAAQIPLYSLETRLPLAHFDWIGFTLQHEVNYTNILTMLDLAGIPLHSADRDASHPLIIGGGEGAFSPEPLASFFDAFIIGDGEEACLDVMQLCTTAKQQNWPRTQVLRELALMPGTYVPSFYDVTYLPDGKIETIALRPADETAAALPTRIHKRYYDVGKDFGSVRPVVPLMRTVHDRLAIEIRRGCVAGCRFCQAGMITRPVNERSLEQIVEIARQGIINTGYDEVSLLSLSSADYTMIAPLVQRMSEEFGPGGVSVSLPSLRINAFDVKLVDEIAKVRKSGFTFAPEAGTTRLRNVINKPVDQDRFFNIIEDVFKRGWRTVKFYFMIGLPTETDEDLDGIVEICERAAALGRQHHGNNATVNVTLSPFVPKSNTPFQWEAQPPREELERRYQYVIGAVRERLGGRGRQNPVDIKTADTGEAYIEAVLARGDRRVAQLIEKAWQLGARFDGWDEHFSLSTWLGAMEATGIDGAFYANRQREETEVLPFDHLESDVGRRFLWADQRRAWRERVMEKCDTGKCAGCDVCDDETIVHTLAQDMAKGSGEAQGSIEQAQNSTEKPSKDVAALTHARSKNDDVEHSTYVTPTMPPQAAALHDVAQPPPAVHAEEITPGPQTLDPRPSTLDPIAAMPHAPGIANRAMETVMVTRQQRNIEGVDQDEAAGPTERKSTRGPKGGRSKKQPRPAGPPPVQRWRVGFTKLDALRFLSHLDFAKVLGLVIRRGAIAIAYSQGFNPVPRISFAPPLSLGMGGTHEQFDLCLTETTTAERLLERLRHANLAGLEFMSATEIPLHGGTSLESEIDATHFEIELTAAATERWPLAGVQSKIAAFLATESFPVSVVKKAGTRDAHTRYMDLRQSLHAVDCTLRHNRPIITLTISQRVGSFVKPQEALGFILGESLTLGSDLRINRTGFVFQTHALAL